MAIRETLVCFIDMGNFKKVFASNMSKDSAIRVLKEFERDQIINLDERRIEVLDSDRLHKISDNG